MGDTVCTKRSKGKEEKGEKESLLLYQALKREREQKASEQVNKQTLCAEDSNHQIEGGGGCWDAG